MKFKIQNSLLRRGFGGQAKFKIDSLIKVLLENRDIKTKKEIEDFLNPDLKNVTAKKVGINIKDLQKSLGRIKAAIKKNEKIVIFGDYDVDGICGTAILWETLHGLGADVVPYIPHRIDEGYGLSIKGIQNVILNLFQDPKHKSKEMLNQASPDQHDNKRSLIITVDNGIVASKAVDFAKKEGIDVIITDHHVPPKSLPKAFAIVHTTKLCGTGVAWVLSNVILNSFQDLKSKNKKMLNQALPDQHDNDVKENHLELVALATVADLVPLKGANRTLLLAGLKALNKTKRIGLLELFKEAGLDKKSIGVYEIGHVIAPRLNAMGRLEYAMDSLRLICTPNPKRAGDLARLLGQTNKERQDLTLQSVLHAKDFVEREKRKAKNEKLKNLLFIAHESYEQGVIGLVAGKMVEEFYRPAIVVAKGEKFSKASARSISGFNIIEFIREQSSLLVDVGGHPMAAGFTVETARLIELQKVLEDKAEIILSKDILTKSLKIDCEIPLSVVDVKLYEALQKLSPFGMGNPEPTFISREVVVDGVRLIGKENKHLKLRLKDEKSGKVFDAIAFSMGDRIADCKIGEKIDVVYTIDENEWPARQSNAQAFAGGNGEKNLQLKIRDFESSSH